MHADLLNSKRPLWQQQMAEAIKSATELLEAVGLPKEMLADTQDFPVRVPRAYVDKIKAGDPQDPLLLQVLPMQAESQNVTGFGHDPVGDIAAARHRGLLQKYHGRALVMTTPACAINCRYCFRRHFPYSELSSRQRDWSDIIQAIASDDSIHEVILSGGDPLALSNNQLQSLCQGLDTISHLKRLRIHSRLPVVLPERIDHGLISLLKQSRLEVCMVLHCNHGNEIDASTYQALQALRNSNITLLNQAVLLRNINDNIDVLTELSESLFDAGVLPYYLHLLDRVQGAAHFEVDDEQARKLRLAMQQRLPGYLVPKFVRELSGEPFKTPLD